MLVEIYIKNFALIEEITIEFGTGFNVLTGETGAGKSILIDAVGMLLGARASTDYIRSGYKKAEIQGVFAITKDIDHLKRILEDAGIPIEDDGTLIMLREINENGRSICRINGRIVTLSSFQEISKLLVEIHGQDSNQQLSSNKKQAELLDRLGGTKLHYCLNNIREIYDQLKRLEKQKQVLEANTNNMIKEKELLKFQLLEISDASLKPDEEEELESELKILSCSQDLIAACLAGNSMLFSGDGVIKSAYDLISDSINNFRGLRGLDNDLEVVLSDLEDLMYRVEDAAGHLKKFSADKEYNPERMQEIEDRLRLINNLQRKYGKSIKEILAYKDELLEKIEHINNSKQRLAKTNEVLAQLSVEYTTLSDTITKLRKIVALDIEEKVSKSLRDLGMPSVRFKVNFDFKPSISPNGMDDIEFQISPNPGEPLKSLAKIASGGEISRIMLALKSILAKADNIPVIIFDEIDAGIGGLIIKPVAEKLLQTSKFSQVICITHSPRIASYADSHYFLKKLTKQNRTITSAIRLNTESERIEEITRMLGATSKAKEHAIELLKEVQECS